MLDFCQADERPCPELGCTCTNFTCVHGLFDYGNVSTAQDLAKIAAACAENQTFAQVAGTASYVLPATNLRKAEHTISSSNSLMNSESANYREYVRWVKGGFYHAGRPLHRGLCGKGRTHLRAGDPWLRYAGPPLCRVR